MAKPSKEVRQTEPVMPRFTVEEKRELEAACAYFGFRKHATMLHDVFLLVSRNPKIAQQVKTLLDAQRELEKEPGE